MNGPVHRLALLLLIHDLGVDDRTIVLLPRVGFDRIGWFAAGAGLAGFGLLGSRFVEFGRYRLPGFVELLTGGFDRGGVAALERVFDFANRLFDPAFVVTRVFVRIILEHLLRAIHGIVR